MQIGRLMVLSLLSTIGRRTPLMGWFVAPVVREAAPCYYSGIQLACLHSRAFRPTKAPHRQAASSLHFGVPAAQQRCSLNHTAQMLFGSGERLLGTERAFILAALGLIPAVAPWALDFLQLWRARCAVSELLATSPTARFLRGRRDRCTNDCYWLLPGQPGGGHHSQHHGSCRYNHKQ